jgi:hypothetical protein
MNELQEGNEPVNGTICGNIARADFAKRVIWRPSRQLLPLEANQFERMTMREGATEEPQVVADGSRWDATGKNCL